MWQFWWHDRVVQLSRKYDRTANDQRSHVVYFSFSVYSLFSVWAKNKDRAFRTRRWTRARTNLWVEREELGSRHVEFSLRFALNGFGCEYSSR